MILANSFGDNPILLLNFRTSCLLLIPENKTKLEVGLATYLRDLFCSLYVKEYSGLTQFNVKEFEAWKLPIAAARLIENVSFQENENLLKFIQMRLASTSL